jgi:hypothetical protein
MCKIMGEIVESPTSLFQQVSKPAEMDDSPF